MTNAVAHTTNQLLHGSHHMAVALIGLLVTAPQSCNIGVSLRYPTKDLITMSKRRM